MVFNINMFKAFGTGRLNGLTDAFDEVLPGFFHAVSEPAEIVVLQMGIGINGIQTVIPFFDNRNNFHHLVLFLYGRRTTPACFKILFRVPLGISLLPCLGTGNVAPVRGSTTGRVSCRFRRNNTPFPSRVWSVH